MFPASLHRCRAEEPYSTPLERRTKETSETTCSTDREPTSSLTPLCTAASFTKTGTNYLTFYSSTCLMSRLNRVYILCFRLKGDGTFTDAQGLVWTGEFHDEEAVGLKLQHSI